MDGPLFSPSFLLMDGLLSPSSLVQIYDLVLGVPSQLFGLTLGGGEVGLEEADSGDIL